MGEPAQNGVPPEKYYEACITYHLVCYGLGCGKKLYPFSITQVQEKERGFDFGYADSGGQAFLIQYKRPLLTQKGGYAWRVERGQLRALLSCGMPAFYALPAFSDVGGWYDALEKTCFLPASAVWGFLCREGDRESALLPQDDRVMCLEVPADALFTEGLRRVQSRRPRAPAPLEGPFLGQALGDAVGYWVKEELL